MVAEVVARARPGDVVVAMSNGAFGGVWGALLTALGGAAGEAPREAPPSPRAEGA